MRYINTCTIHPKDYNKIENYLKEKGLNLEWISESVNNFAIAHVSLIEPPEDTEEQQEFQVVINLREQLCCKFNFFGYRTDGLRIYNQSKLTNPKFLDCKFNISFIETINGAPTSFILITYTDFTYDIDYDDDNYEGKIFASIVDFSASENYNNTAVFKFSDFLNYTNSVKVSLIDDENYPGIFAYKLVSEGNHDYDDYEDSRDYEDVMARERFSGIWNKTLWCVNKRIIPLESDNIFQEANNIMYEIRKEQQSCEEDDDYDYNYDDEM